MAGQDRPLEGPVKLPKPGTVALVSCFFAHFQKLRYHLEKELCNLRPIPIIF